MLPILIRLPSVVRLACCVAIVSVLAPGIQAQTPLGHGYTRDGEHIHFEGGGVTGLNGETRIDAPSQENIDGFQRAMGRKLTLCTNLDAASFVPLSVEYSRDRDRVYYKWISPGRFLVIELPKADVASFEVLSGVFAKDANTVWYMDQPMARSDPASFVIVDHQMGKDRNHVYFSGQRVRHLHAPTFRHLASGYFADQNAVYWGVDAVRGADPATFEVLGNSFIGKDAESVFRSGQLLNGLDAATVKLILHDPYGYQIFSDRHGVYVNGLKFLHANPGNVVARDNLSAVGGRFLFVVDTYHSTPITVFREDGGLVVETVMYDPQSRKALGVVRANLTQNGMENTTVSPMPGGSDKPSVADWQIQVFERPDLVELLREKADLHLP
jgi:hypothetical protein